VATGVFLWRRAAARGERRSPILALVGLLVALALARPTLLAPAAEVVIVLDASASMAAGERWQEALKAARARLLRARRAAVVRAGLSPRVLGPGPGPELAETLTALAPGDAGLDREAALLLAARVLPGAELVWIGDTDPGTGAFIPAGGGETNVGIVRLEEDFLALASSDPGPRRIEVEVDGEVCTLLLPARGYGACRLPPASRHRARVLGEDALALDDVSFYLRKRPGVELEHPHPALLRALWAVGLEPRPRGELAVRFGTPEGPVQRPTLFFAEAGGEATLVADREAGHPLLLGVELLGERLPLPPPPGEGFFPLAVDEEGRGLIWWDGKSLYLPMLEAIYERPFFPVLLYNFFAPHLRAKKPLGEDGVLTPTIRNGVAYVLEAPEESLLPEPPPARPEEGTKRTLVPYLLLLAALLLALEERLPE